MALKDWKKVKAGIMGWEHKRLKILVRLGQEKGEFYNIKIIEYGRTTLDKYFKTKSQALKFAKSYMRKH